MMSPAATAAAAAVAAAAGLFPAVPDLIAPIINRDQLLVIRESSEI